MVRHIVLWRLKSESDADFQAIRAALEGQAGRIPGLRRVEVGRSGTRRPCRTYPAVPAMAIGKPFAAAVPIARRSGSLHHVRNGMVRNAPPAATRLDTAPMIVPAVKMPSGPGSSRVDGGFRSSSICVAA